MLSSLHLRSPERQLGLTHTPLSLCSFAAFKAENKEKNAKKLEASKKRKSDAAEGGDTGEQATAGGGAEEQAAAEGNAQAEAMEVEEGDAHEKP